MPENPLPGVGVIPTLARTSRYALAAMKRLAELDEGERIPASLLARDAEVPPAFLAKILRGLEAAGLVNSRRGPGGGYRLALPADRIRLADVLCVVDPQANRPMECAMGVWACGEREPCPLHERWEEVLCPLIDLFGSMTLGELVRMGEGRMA